MVLFYGDALLHQDFGGRQGQTGVTRLVGPQQVGGEMFPVVVKPRVVEAAGREATAAEIASHAKAGGLERLGLFFNHGNGGRLCHTGHHGGGGLDDAGLLVGDGGHRVAQVAFVLQ